jgi:hypothetical protein
MKDVKSLQQTLGSAQDVHKAKGILGQVLELFADAEGVSTKFKSRAEADDTNLLVYDTQADLDPVMASLHQKMRTLSIKRQNHSELRQKAKWALYEEKHFKRLIEDITDLVNDLVDLFPAAQASRRELCQTEVSEFDTGESLRVLKDIVAGQDKYLEAAISKAVENRVSQIDIYTWTFENANVGLEYRNQYLEQLRQLQNRIASGKTGHLRKSKFFFVMG